MLHVGNLTPRDADTLGKLSLRQAFSIAQPSDRAAGMQIRKDLNKRKSLILMFRRI